MQLKSKNYPLMFWVFASLLLQTNQAFASTEGFIRAVRTLMQGDEFASEQFDYFFESNTGETKVSETFTLLLRRRGDSGMRITVPSHVRGEKSCLQMNFDDKHRIKIFYKKPSFTHSHLFHVNRGVCAKNNDEAVSGTTIVKLADQLNSDLKIKNSSLTDLSTILKGQVSLKLLSLVMHGKTWYGRAGGFQLLSDNRRSQSGLYEISDSFAKITVGLFLEISSQLRISKIPGVWNQTMILLELSDQTTLRDFFRAVFKSEELSDKDKIRLWRFAAFTVPDAIPLNTDHFSADEQKAAKNLLKWSEKPYHTVSKKTYSY